jgi:ABC-type antimicrobial peptide transport system permease subunit
MNDLELVIKSLMKRKLSVLLVALQITVSILFLIFIACTMQKVFYLDITVSNNLKPNTSQILHFKLNTDSVTPKKYFEFRKQMLKQSYVDSIGYFNNTYPVIIDNLSNSPALIKMKAESKQKDSFSMPGGISIIEIGKGMQELKPLEVTKGRNFENSDFSSKQSIIPILVGYNYIKYNIVNIGTELYDSSNNKKYKVIGVLKEHSTWFGYSSSFDNLEYLDNLFVVALNDGDFYPRPNYYCIVNNSKAVPEVLANMLTTSNKEGLSIEVKTVSNELKEYRQEVIDDNIKWLMFSLFFILMTSLGMASVMISSVVSRSKEIGIRIAVGYSTKHIQKLFIMEVLLIILLSSLVSIIISIYTINMSSSSLTGDHVSLPIIAIVVGISLLMSIPPVTAIIYRLKRLQPRELIGGKE